MAELQHEYQDWASRKAGKSIQGAQPQAEQDETESSSEHQTDAEPAPPAHECLSHAAQEITEAIEMLEKAKGQVEDPDEVQAAIDALTEQEQTLTAKAKELADATGDEDEDESEDDELTPGPEAG